MVLPNNYSMALRCLQNLEKTLVKSPEIVKSYQETIRKYLEKGYIRKIEPIETFKESWYLPHFAVTKPDRTTTKTCIVFDASAKCNVMIQYIKALNYNRNCLMFC